MSSYSELLRRLPSVERLLAEPVLVQAATLHGRTAVRDAARRRLAALRNALRCGHMDGEVLLSELAVLPERVAGAVDEDRQAPYRRVLNAAGILVHTNLGRAPLAGQAVAAATRAAAEPLALEYDLEAGARGSRRQPVNEALGGLFPDREGLVVGNNAAAVMLALNTWARGRDVLISRGELVEIGGSFRVPDILERSGARLREVGTTNRTRIEDFRAALGEGTAMILRVHPSNFHQVGFTQQAATRELAATAREAGIPFVVDQGSGNVQELAPYGIRDEPTVASILEAGADVVTFSGDKLLGGPQSGIIVGAPAWVGPMAANPMARALRPDKMILAALVETLRLHCSGLAFSDIPVLHRLAMPQAEVQERAEALSRRLQAGGVPPECLELRPGFCRVGGGSSPSGQLPTTLVCLDPRGTGADRLAARLRTGVPAVVGRIADDHFLLDLRGIAPEEDELLAEAVLVALEREE